MIMSHSKVWRTMMKVIVTMLTMSIIICAPDSQVSKARNSTFVVISKDSSENYQESKEGCEAKAKELDVICDFRMPQTNTSEPARRQWQKDIAGEIIDGHKKKTNSISGVAISFVNETEALDIFQDFKQTKIPAITFDSRFSKENNATHRAFVGIDNEAMGMLLGKILQQTHSTNNMGKMTYNVITAKGTIFDERLKGVEGRLKQESTDLEWDRGNLFFIDNITSGNLAEFLFNASNIYPSDLDRIKELNESECKELPDAIVSLLGKPMRYPNNETFQFVMSKFTNCDMTFVCGDSFLSQVELFIDKDAHGLVGQSFYEMGEKSIEVLHNISTNKTFDETVHAGLIQFIPEPADLKRDLENHYVWEYFPYFITLVVVNYACCIYCFYWTCKNKETKVVKTAQPMFLYFVVAGVLFISTSLVFNSIDDSDEFAEVLSADTACRYKDWLLVIGLSIILSTFFSKTLRINKASQNSEVSGRIEIDKKDILGPFLLLVGINLSLLLAWRIRSPREFEREYAPGSDKWNRPFESIGFCTKSDEDQIFMSLMYLTLLCFAFVSVYHAFKARDVQVEYWENFYINASYACVVQVFLILFPVGLRKKDPVARIASTSVGFFVVNTAVLGLIFVPKMIECRKETKAEMSKMRASKIIEQGLSYVVKDTVILENRTKTTKTLQKLMASLKMKIYDDYLENITRVEKASSLVNRQGEQGRRLSVGARLNKRRMTSLQNSANDKLQTLTKFQTDMDGVKEDMTALRDRLAERYEKILDSLDKESSSSSDSKKVQTLRRDADMYSRVIEKLNAEIEIVQKEHYADESYTNEVSERSLPSLPETFSKGDD